MLADVGTLFLKEKSMFEYLMAVNDRAEQARRTADGIYVGRRMDGVVKSILAAEEAAYTVLAAAQARCHRLFAKAVDEWEKDGSRNRGASVVAVLRAATRLATSYGNGRAVTGREAVEGTAWLRGDNRHGYANVPAAERAALDAAMAVVEADERLEEKLLTEEQENRPEWMENAGRKAGRW